MCVSSCAWKEKGPAKRKGDSSTRTTGWCLLQGGVQWDWKKMGNIQQRWRKTVISGSKITIMYKKTRNALEKHPWDYTAFSKRSVRGKGQCWACVPAAVSEITGRPSGSRWRQRGRELQAGRAVKTCSRPDSASQFVFFTHKLPATPWGRREGV